MIKASFEMVQPVTGQSFLFRRFDNTAFDAPYHFHPEYELTYILDGSGKRYVGSHMEDFAPGDLVLLGPNLPHCWKLNDDGEEKARASAIVVQFDSAFLGEDFFSKNELQYIKRLLDKSGGGLSFHGRAQRSAAHHLETLSHEKSNFKLLIGVLEVLQRLASSPEYALLDQNMVTAERNITDQERINPVFAYLVENFRTNVSLNAAADIAHMTTNAFCKYFKKITRKTFMETIIEYRLNYATQQLIQTDKPISDISFESGFGDVSHFYKTFKTKMGLSPLNYRKKFMHNLGDEQQAAVA